MQISTSGGTRQVKLNSKERRSLGNVQGVLKDIGDLLGDDDAKAALVAVVAVEKKYPVAVKQV